MSNKSAIRNMIFEGRGCNDNVKPTKKYYEYLDTVIENEEFFLKEIKKDKRIYEQFKKYQQAVDDFNLEECIMHYEEVFRFGVLLGLDLVGYIKE